MRCLGRIREASGCIQSLGQLIISCNLGGHLLSGVLRLNVCVVLLQACLRRVAVVLQASHTGQGLVGWLQ